MKSEYQAATARPVECGALFFQIRQAFPPGEVTADEANKIGYETAMRWTKGKYQFFVCTHTDKGHIHNHIYYNSTAYGEPITDDTKCCNDWGASFKYFEHQTTTAPRFLREAYNGGHISYGYPKEQAIRIVADATQQFSCKYEMTVYFVFFDKGVSQSGKSWLHIWGKTPDTIFIANLLR